MYRKRPYTNEVTQHKKKELACASSYCLKVNIFCRSITIFVVSSLP